MAGMRIAGIGVYAPKNVVSNDDIAVRLKTEMEKADTDKRNRTGQGLTDEERALFTTNDRWIRRFIGFSSRRFVSPDEGTIDMAEKASRVLFEGLGVNPVMVDGIVFGSVTPSYPNSPPDANLLQYRLGIPPDIAGRPNRVFGIDTSLACCTWVASVQLVYALIKSGMCRVVLLIGADTMSTTINWRDRAFATVLGDLGTATLFAATPDEEDWFGIRNFFSVLDGQHWQAIITPKGGSKCPVSSEDELKAFSNKLSMDGPLVKGLVVPSVGGVVTEEALRYVDWGLHELDFAVFHEANLAQLVRPIADIWRMAGFRGEVLDARGEFSNTTSASVPAAIAMNSHKFQPITDPPKKIAMVAMGGSMTTAYVFAEIKRDLPIFLDV